MTKDPAEETTTESKREILQKEIDEALETLKKLPKEAEEKIKAEAEKKTGRS